MMGTALTRLPRSIARGDRDCATKQKWPGLLPAILHCVASPQRGGAVPGGGGGSEAWPPLSSGVMRRTVTRRLIEARSVGLLLQILLAVALRRQVLRRHTELLGQQFGRGLRAAIRQRQIVDVVADRVGVAFDQEHLARVALDRPIEAVGDHLQPRSLVRRDGPRARLEVDRVDVDARHLHANIGAVADLVERVAPIDPLHRRCLHGPVDHVRRRILGVDDVAIVGNADDRRRQRRHRSRRPTRGSR